MRTLAVTENTTVDGSIEMLGDWFDPQGQGAVDSADLMEELHRQGSQSDALLLGRQTFEDFRGYWPLQTEDPTGISAYLDQVQKYVVSSTLTDPAWQNSTVLAGDPVAAVHALVAAGLVDEYRLFTYPVVQGRGRRLFPDGFEAPRLRLLESRAFRSGITYARYAAG